MAAPHVQQWHCFLIGSVLSQSTLFQRKLVYLCFQNGKKAVLVLIFCLTTLSHAQGTYTYNWNRATIKILHCHPVVNVSKTWGCSARRYGNDPLRNVEATQHSRQQLKHQELAPCYPGKQSRIPNDIISHFSSSNAVSSRDLSEDTQSTPKNTSSFKGKYSGWAVNSTCDTSGQVRQAHMGWRGNIRSHWELDRALTGSLESSLGLTLTYEKYGEVHL